MGRRRRRSREGCTKRRFLAERGRQFETRTVDVTHRSLDSLAVAVFLDQRDENLCVPRRGTPKRRILRLLDERLADGRRARSVSRDDVRRLIALADRRSLRLLTARSAVRTVCGTRRTIREATKNSEEASQGSSNSIAAPCPNPTHSVAIPRSTPRRFISWTSVTGRRAPEHPSGCPIAIAPPLTLS